MYCIVLHIILRGAVDKCNKAGESLKLQPKPVVTRDSSRTMAVACLFIRMVLVVFLLIVPFVRSLNMFAYLLSALHERIAKESHSPSSCAKLFTLLTTQLRRIRKIRSLFACSSHYKSSSTFALPQMVLK